MLPAKWTCLLGHSGVGKSTLLRLIAGLGTGGQFEGSICNSAGQALSASVSYMAQSDLLFPWLTVRQNIELGFRLRGESIDNERTGLMIDQVGLSGHADKHPPALSGGMRQRTALARTLMEDNVLVLLDEPFSALDARTRAEMQELAFRVLQNKTVLLVTHDPGESARLGDRIYVMTEWGMQEHPCPECPAIRELDDPNTIATQVSLMNALRNR